MKRIIYTRLDGGVSVVTPNINTNEILTEEEALQRAFDKLPSSAINPQIVEANTISSDRTFRNAWEKDEKVIKTNMTKAKDMTKDRLRAERKPLLEAQDVAFQRALEESADTSAIVTEKKRLRDITKQVDGMKTIDDLKKATI
tara:strand:+ start:576 stop:1004 length:429 start_codon:yes stop_codon:yes gene_type:complete